MNDQCREEDPDNTRNMNLDLSSCSDQRETTPFSIRPLSDQNMRDGVISLDDPNIPPQPNRSPVTQLQNPSESRNVNKDPSFGTHLPERANTTYHNPSPDLEIDFPKGITMIEVTQHVEARGDNPQNRGNNPEQPDPHFRVKPPRYDGKDDVYEYLNSFEICSQINGWSPYLQGLYLASSLTGSTRGILTELQRNERTGINVLTQKLRERYGTVNQKEVFRAKLRGRARKVGESISDLAQDIKKMTILAYPNAHIEFLETIAKNHFIDSFNEQEMRLKLREADPKTLSQAEQMATRLEAYKIADKQRYETIPVTAGLRTHDQRNSEGQYPQNCNTNSTRQYSSTNPTTENKTTKVRTKTVRETSTVFLEVHKETTATHMEQGPNSVRNVSGKSIHEGLFLPIQIQSQNIKALIDAGSNITLLRKNSFDSWAESEKPLIQPTSDILLGITGNTARFHEKIEVEVQIGKQKILYSLFLADIANECIIGRDFMLSHNCDIILSEGL
ncbi:hypothetical protein MAR_028530 [Mya arenaria]|uniref:Peptidase A2 domain-containing protein n=1 Tax=Mya arenaria TaxID=6604 RepID=A0ABY7DLH9_MYAAR|nr:hypothetical protein MAR_028530 [Mya arenaria]